MMLQIIILNYNSAKECVELYKQLQVLTELDYSIVVIDNNSNLQDKQILLENLPPDLLRFNKKNLGYAEGNRIGIELAIKKNIPYFLLLNPDIRLSPLAISHLIKTIKEDQNIAVVGPRICYRKDPNLIYSDGGIVHKEKGFNTSHLNYNKKLLETGNMEMIHEVDYVNGSVFLVRTEILKEIGFMRSDFFLYFEETEWCLRAKKNKYKLVINSNAIAYHSESPKGKNYHYYMTRNRIILSKMQNRLYFQTVLEVTMNIWKNSKKSIKKRKKPSTLYFAKFKGLLAGILNI